MSSPAADVIGRHQPPGIRRPARATTGRASRMQIHAPARQTGPDGLCRRPHGAGRPARPRRPLPCLPVRRRLDLRETPLAAAGRGEAAGAGSHRRRRHAAAQPALHPLSSRFGVSSAGLDKRAMCARLAAARTCPQTWPPPGALHLWRPEHHHPGPLLRAVAAKLANGRVAPIPAAGRSAHLEHAATFSALTETFLDDIG